MDRLQDRLLDLHVPQFCSRCGGRMVFQGVGEYKCEKCGSLEYDDYGKIRICLENSPGATIVEAEQRTGVSQRTIRRLLKEGRLLLTEDSKVMLHCEKCGAKIRSGMLCPDCEKKEELLRGETGKRHTRSEGLHGYSVHRQDESKGRRRYHGGVPTDE